MKKALRIIIPIVLVLALLIGGFLIYFIHTPEFALLKTMYDVKKHGLDGLEKHLTENGAKIVSPIKKVANIMDNAWVDKILSLFTSSDTDYMSLLVEKASEVKWSLEDIVKSKGTATVVIGFNYHDKITGTVDLGMLKVDGDWKIDNLSNFKLKKFS